MAKVRSMCQFVGVIAGLILAICPLSALAQQSWIIGSGNPVHGPVQPMVCPDPTTGVVAACGSGGGGGGGVITGPLGNQTLGASVAVTACAGCFPDLTTGNTNTANIYATLGNGASPAANTTNAYLLQLQTNTTSQASGTMGVNATVTTPNTFQQLVAINTSRKNCTFQNTGSTDPEYFYFGTTANANTATTAGAFKVLAGNAISTTTPGGITETNAVQYTGPNSADPVVWDCQ